MSTTGRGRDRIPNDAYNTPPSVASVMCDRMNLQGRMVLEPSAGQGPVVNALVSAGAKVISNDIEGGIDYLTSTQLMPGIVDAVMTNPPFTTSCEFVDKARKEASTVVMLQRLNWLGSYKRLEWWQGNMPTHIYVLVPRPSFAFSGTDSNEYGWFVWTDNWGPGAVMQDTPGLYWLKWR